MYNSILVPLDGSECAEIALTYAEAIVSKSKGELVLVSVADYQDPDARHVYRSYLDHTVETVERELKDWQEGLAIRDELLTGEAADVLIERASKGDISLIVMSIHSSVGNSWLLSSLASKILRAVDTPILLVRTSPTQQAVRQKQLVRTILVPLDGSKMGEAAIPYAAALARQSDARLVLFRVLPFLSSGGAAAPFVMPSEKRRRAVLTYLKGVSDRLRKEGLSASTAIDIGAPARKIIEYAGANNIDLIAISSHAESGFTRWVFGSVTDKILRSGNTAVLMVRRTTKAEQR